MRLYSRTGAIALTDPATGTQYQADDDGAFDLDDDFAESQHHFHFGGKPVWEDEAERHRRLLAEERERSQDPATLLNAVQQLLAATKAAQAVSEPEPERPARRTTKRTAAASE